MSVLYFGDPNILDHVDPKMGLPCVEIVETGDFIESFSEALDRTLYIKVVVATNDMSIHDKIRSMYRRAVIVSGVKLESDKDTDEDTKDEC